MTQVSKSGNISLLESGGYKYIIGARIKNEAEATKQWILSREKTDGCFFEIKKGNYILNSPHTLAT